MFWNKVKVFFGKLWKDFWPILKSLLIFCLNWFWNWIKNKAEHNKYLKKLVMTQSDDEVLDYKEWKEKCGHPNAWEKTHLTKAELLERKKNRV